MSGKSLFPRTHLWLILPFVITISGFIFYWMSFNNSPFRHHVHGLSATAWYILVIVQPYLYQQNKIQLHRKVGLLGLFLAGALVFSGLQNLPFTLSSGAPIEMANGIIYLSFLQLTGFSFSVFMAIRFAKNTRVHGRWLVTTVFWPLLPALARIILAVIPKAAGFVITESFTVAIYLSHMLILLVLIVIMIDDYRKEKKVYLSYILLSVALIIMSLTYTYMSRTQWWGDFLQELLKQ